MPRRGRETIRCEHCRLREDLCVCKNFLPVELSTKVLILMHRREVKVHTGTALLARRAISNCEIFFRGWVDDVLTTEVCRPAGYQSLVLYPTEEAICLTDFIKIQMRTKEPIHLIVPDGSWRQCKKAARREQSLMGIPNVKLPLGTPSIYTALRPEPTAEALSTFEAIARALGVIHGAHVQSKLEDVFKKKVQNTLVSRGFLPPGHAT